MIIQVLRLWDPVARSVTESSPAAPPPTASLGFDESGDDTDDEGEDDEEDQFDIGGGDVHSVSLMDYGTDRIDGDAADFSGSDSYTLDELSIDSASIVNQFSDDEGDKTDGVGFSASDRRAKGDGSRFGLTGSGVTDMLWPCLDEQGRLRVVWHTTC